MLLDPRMADEHVRSIGCPRNRNFQQYSGACALVQDNDLHLAAFQQPLTYLEPSGRSRTSPGGTEVHLCTGRNRGGAVRCNGPPPAYSSLRNCQVANPILLPALFIVLRAEWPFLSVADRLNAVCRDTLL